MFLEGIEMKTSTEKSVSVPEEIKICKKHYYALGSPDKPCPDCGATVTFVPQQPQ
jgi:hypothetical protein